MIFFRFRIDFLTMDISDIRSIPLDAVMRHFGATPDPADPKRNWRTECGRITVTGERFYNHDLERGGGGAIDLAMHLGDFNFKGALAYLSRAFGSEAAIEQYRHDADMHARRIIENTKAPTPHTGLPESVPERLSQVQAYLVAKRGISPEIVKEAIGKGNLYADRYGNCCFSLRDVTGRKIGVELRGSYDAPFHGNRGEKGLFFCGKAASDTEKKGVFCESAIDALSYLTLARSRGEECVVVSTTGSQRKRMIETAREMVKRGYRIVAAFDRDRTGDVMSAALKEGIDDLSPSFTRELPPPSCKDWNEALQKQKGISQQAVHPSHPSEKKRTPNQKKS